jgi:hypothetical protein
MWSGCWASARTLPQFWAMSSPRTDGTHVAAGAGPELNDRSTAACSPSWLAGTDPLLPFGTVPGRSAPQCKELVAAAGRTPGQRNQPDIQLGSQFRPECQQSVGQLTTVLLP